MLDSLPCASSRMSRPSGEGRDWIIKCEVQDQVYPLLKEAEAALKVLIGS
jgi:hypothetical protein